MWFQSKRWQQQHQEVYIFTYYIGYGCGTGTYFFSSFLIGIWSKKQQQQQHRMIINQMKKNNEIKNHIPALEVELVIFSV